MWEEGCAEPWIGGVLQALIRCYQHHPLRVLETGGFVGYTSEKLADVLLPEDELIVCDIDVTRSVKIQEALDGARCHTTVVADDVLEWLATQPRESLDFVFLDDDHQQAHVAEELDALISKMKVGGLICGHDVYGVCQLHEVFTRFGGYSLALPFLGPAGGLGILQV